MTEERMAQRLRELRGERRQQDVANAVGITRNAYCVYEAGKRVPRDEIKLKLAKYFGVSVGSLFFGE